MHTFLLGFSHRCLRICLYFKRSRKIRWWREICGRSERFRYLSEISWQWSSRRSSNTRSLTSLTSA